jgi:hypothetical protein
MFLEVPKDRNSFIVGLEDKGVTSVTSQHKCNFSEDLDFQKRHCDNLRSPNLEVNKIVSQIYVSIQV